jgi:glutamine amidotransferase
MCRLIGYRGKTSILLSELVEKPENSLIKQSLETKLGKKGINADGFGISWYNQDIDDTPGVFKSTQPAWNDNNLKRICNKILSNCFLGHVRASTVGDVTVNNCHPFSYKKYSFIHNGTIHHFEKIRRPLLNALREEFFNQIKAQTDSEHLFFLIMHFLFNEAEQSLEQSILKAFNWVIENQRQEDENHFSKLNIIITDGKSLIATRFASKDNDTIPLYYNINNHDDSIIIASEALSHIESTDWQLLPQNSYLTVDEMPLKIQIKSF